MTKKMFVFLGIVFCFVAVPLTVWADSKTYTPPAEKGKIYVVVKFAGTAGIASMDVNINIKWGNWQKSGKFNNSGGRTPKEGFVIELKHTKNDSVPLTVTTSNGGRILDVYQGGEPSQKGNSNWHYARW